MAEIIADYIFPIIICVTLAAFCIFHEIKIRRYAKVEAEIVDYNDDYHSCYSLMQKIVVYRYYWNGTEHTGCESASVSRRRLAGTETCIIYVDPDDCEKFITSFKIASLRRWLLAVMVFLILIAWMIINSCTENPAIARECEKYMRLHLQ